jgi:hypothetical protein
MDTLFTNTNLKWTGFYLKPPEHPDTSWMGASADLKLQGWGFAPLYVGLQEGDPNLIVRGTTDGNDAATQLSNAGFPNRSVIYLDIESGNKPSNDMQTYTSNWISAVLKSRCVPGLYCSYKTANYLYFIYHGLCYGYLPLWVWSISQPQVPLETVKAPYPSADPSDSGVASARMWQYKQGVDISILNATILKDVDLDTSNDSDPST